MPKLFTLATLMLMLVTATVFGWDQPANSDPSSVPVSRTGEIIPREIISSGGIAGNTTSYSLNGTVGQLATGSGSSTSFGVGSGFWPNLSGGSPTCCVGTLGDVKLEPDCDPTDQTVDIADLTNLINHLFISFVPICCVEEADIAPAIVGEVPDGVVDISDLTAMIDHLFISFPRIPDCQ